MRINPGALRHRVTIANPSQPTSDGDGGAAVRWPPDGGVLLGARVPASIEVAGARAHTTAKTTEGIGGYTVRLRYLAGISLASRLTWHDGAVDRTLWVNGIVDDDQQHARLELTCAERVET